MVITMVGPPSGFVQCGLHIIRIMAEVLLKDVDVLATCEVEQLRHLWRNRQHDHLIIFSDCPERPLVNVLKQAKASVLVLCEDPRDIIGFIMRERGLEWSWATRFANQCVATISDFFQENSTTLIERSPSLTIGDFIKRVAEHLGLELDAAAWRDIILRLGDFDGNSPESLFDSYMLAINQNARPPGVGLETLAPDERRAVEDVSLFMETIIRGGRIEQAKWPTELFLAGDFPDRVLRCEIDMLGRSRCLSFGPYLHLPIGNWGASIEFQVSENISGAVFEVDLYHRDVQVSDEFPIAGDSGFVVKVDFQVTEPREPVQVRIILKDGAIDGKLMLRSASVERKGLHQSG